jgi:hypothetical protein
MLLCTAEAEAESAVLLCFFCLMVSFAGTYCFSENCLQYWLAAAAAAEREGGTNESTINTRQTTLSLWQLACSRDNFPYSLDASNRYVRVIQHEVHS